VPVRNDYHHRHQEIQNEAYQAQKLAGVRSRKTTTKRREDFKPVGVGGMEIIFGDQFATVSGRSRKLQSR